LHLLDDNPTYEDSLGFASTADVIVTAIKNASRRPLTIGVFGGWGSGKTSLMQMVEASLKKGGIKTVWFNAWKYSGKEVVWNALIQTVLLAMKSDPDVQASRYEDFRDRVLSVSLSLAKYAAKVGTRLIPGGIIREGDVDDLWAALSSDVKDGSLFEFMNRFEAEFGRLVGEYVGDAYLVVFIDDLDRCLPENAIEVMEALKLYLDRANCVFVIGIEPSIIEAAITLRYGASSNLSASMYLEKIIQLPIAVPRVRTAAGLKLISSGAEGFSPEQKEQFFRLIRIGMDRNPRRIKRFANAYAVALSGVPERPAKERLVLAKVLLVQMRFPDFYRELTRSPGLIKDLEDAGWEDVGEDRELRRFLTQTQGIPASAELVRPWIRVTETTATELGLTSGGERLT
jgi:KAP family P-loop domain